MTRSIQVAGCLGVLWLNSACSDSGVLQTRQLSEAVAEIGLAEGDTGQILHQVVAIHEDPRGYLYVLQLNNPTVAVFDEQARRVGTLGGAGGGPGDLSLPTFVQTSGDSIWVGDPRAGKVSRFDRSLTFQAASLLRSEVPGLFELYERVDPLGVLVDGSFLVSGGARDSVFWHVSGEPTPILSARISTVRGHAQVGDRHIFIIQPFRDDPILAVDPDRETAARLSRDTDSLYVEIIGLGDRQVRRLPIASEPSRVSEAQIDAEIERFAESLRGTGTGTGEVREALRGALYVPDVTHGVTGLVMGRDSTIAVVFQRDVAGPSDVVVADHVRGRLIGSFRLPVGARLMSFGREAVWLLEKDSRDVEFLTKRLLQGR